MAQEDQLLTVLTPKRLNLPVGNVINFIVNPIAFAKAQALASIRPAASTWGTMNASSEL